MLVIETILKSFRWWCGVLVHVKLADTDNNDRDMDDDYLETADTCLDCVVF